MSGRLTGKGALILGAGGQGNMGQAIARRFAREGAKLVVSARSTAAIENLATELAGTAVTCDIRSKSSIEALADEARATLGRIDIAVDCTGANFAMPFLETTGEQLQDLFDLQFRGPFQFMQVMVEAMDHGGSIIRISSAASTIMLDDYAAYRGTKAAMDQVARSVADEFGSQGIRVNSISPGAVRTPMTAEVWAHPGVVAEFDRTSPLGRTATVDEIAAAAVWLAEDDCFMTGENLHVSGGLMLRSNPTKQQIQAAMALTAAT
ncbi:SDR family NAD(P)-dependent oxidoreductase [Novosphingobium sp. PY1]|uniref:SDR family NAD(P)-dependent oxidoreductase n=1 Tax=Novosphingobium sp. PY1 TaxID=1882221 RepID=UPI001AA49739|nr:SDR family oxidoreductase [Novosphingobium sp. PY1]GFM30535.1 short-chain dehydrogenase/reductase SDR [Novosphingobium sp. PY1]